MSLSKVSVENSLKPEKFVKISWVDKLLPNYFSILKYLSITDFSVVKAQSYESFVPVKLLRGVDLTKHLYVTLLGVVVLVYGTYRNPVGVVLLLLWLTQGCILLQKELYANFQLPPPSANSLLGSSLTILSWLRMPFAILGLYL